MAFQPRSRADPDSPKSSPARGVADQSDYALALERHRRALADLEAAGQVRTSL